MTPVLLAIAPIELMTKANHPWLFRNCLPKEVRGENGCGRSGMMGNFGWAWVSHLSQSSYQRAGQRVLPLLLIFFTFSPNPDPVSSLTFLIWTRSWNSSNFIDRDPEAQRGEGMCPNSHSTWISEFRVESRTKTSERVQAPCILSATMWLSSLSLFPIVPTARQKGHRTWQTLERVFPQLQSALWNRRSLGAEAHLLWPYSQEKSWFQVTFSKM